MLLVALWGCDGGSSGTETTPPPAYQGVIAAIRWLQDGAPVGDAKVFAGSGAPADPDAGGSAYFFDLLPARSPISASTEGSTLAVSTPDVLPHVVSGVALVIAPRPAGVTVDPTAGAELDGPAIHVSLPPSILALEGVAVTDPVEVSILRPDESERALIPGDQLAIRHDVDVSPTRIVEVVNVRALLDGEDLGLVPGSTFTLTYQLPADSPLLADEGNVRSWHYTGSGGYWAGGSGVTFDDAARTVTVEVGALGWLALGLEAPDRPCVSGRFVDPSGAPLPGVELRSFEDGLMGVDRLTSQPDGTFCLPLDDAATATFSALGYDATRTSMYTASGTVAGSLGDVRMDAWQDQDEDRSFDGPGGDCDDNDPEVGPSPGLADGSWCGDPL